MASASLGSIVDVLSPQAKRVIKAPQHASAGPGRAITADELKMLADNDTIEAVPGVPASPRRPSSHSQHDVTFSTATLSVPNAADTPASPCKSTAPTPLLQPLKT